MEYMITVTKSGSVSSYREEMFHFAMEYMTSLAQQKIAFSFEIVTK